MPTRICPLTRPCKEVLQPWRPPERGRAEVPAADAAARHPSWHGGARPALERRRLGRQNQAEKGVSRCRRPRAAMRRPRRRRRTAHGRQTGTCRAAERFSPVCCGRDAHPGAATSAVWRTRPQHQRREPGAPAGFGQMTAIARSTTSDRSLPASGGCDGHDPAMSSDRDSARLPVPPLIVIARRNAAPRAARRRVRLNGTPSSHGSASHDPLCSTRTHLDARILLIARPPRKAANARASDTAAWDGRCACRATRSATPGRALGCRACRAGPGGSRRAPDYQDAEMRRAPGAVTHRAWQRLASLLVSRCAALCLKSCAGGMAPIHLH